MVHVSYKINKCNATIELQNIALYILSQYINEMKYG